MAKRTTFDFWYAVNNTEIVQLPSRHLETFGTTVLNYHLVSELMDSVNQIRVREGRMQASRPQIITPEAYSKTLLEGFGDQARRYVDWLKEHEKDVQVILQYGYTLKHEAFSEHVVSDNLQAVVERVKTDVSGRSDPLSAVLIGVDDPWDVCLVKLFVEIIQQSASTNISEMRQRKLLELTNGVPNGVREDVEASFLAASKNPALIRQLGEQLQKNGLFNEYQDRFFSLVKAAKRN